MEDQEKPLVKIEKTITTLVIVGLICLISMQIVLSSNFLRELAGLEPKGEGLEYETVLPATEDDTGLFGNITVEVVGYDSLSAAVLLINGEEAGSFEQGSVVARVYEGDVVEIDASAYNTWLTFLLVQCSSNIKKESLAKELTMQGGRGELGQITFK